MTDLVRIYHDVDNVLNAQMPVREWGSKPENGWATARDFRGERTWPIRWSPAYIERLNALEGLIEVVWATTWREAALTEISPLVGLTVAQSVIHPLDGITRFPSMGWKRLAIREEQERDPSKFIWLEDEVGPLERSWAVEAGGYAPYIDPRLGVTPKIMDRMEEYIADESGEFDLWDFHWKTPSRFQGFTPRQQANAPDPEDDIDQELAV